METILEAVNIILFPDLRPDNEDSKTEESDVCTYFPHIVSTMGFAICRPSHGTFMSVSHKCGYDDIGMLLTLLLDNKKWLFQLSPVFDAKEDECLIHLPRENHHPSVILPLIQSGVVTMDMDSATSFSETDRRLFQIESYIDYGVNPLIPRPSDIQVDKPMLAEELYDLQTVALGRREMHTTSVSIQVAGSEVDNPYNIRAPNVVRELTDQMESLAALLLQSVIRRKNASFIYRMQQDCLVTLPKRPNCCLRCGSRKQIVIQDFSIYFTETDWLESLTCLEMKSRDELLQHIQMLQLQLFDAENHIQSSARKRVVLSDPYLLEKYSYYYKVLSLLWKRRSN